jgi:hypothetical protein
MNPADLGTPGITFLLLLHFEPISVLMYLTGLATSETNGCAEISPFYRNIGTFSIADGN